MYKLLQKEYKRRHGWMGKTLHWDVCGNKGFKVYEIWYEHKPFPCTES